MLLIDLIEADRTADQLEEESRQRSQITCLWSLDSTPCNAAQPLYTRMSFTCSRHAQLQPHTQRQTQLIHSARSTYSAGGAHCCSLCQLLFQTTGRLQLIRPICAKQGHTRDAQRHGVESAASSA